jgi:predicted nuclease of predicted toxin-antitoxin system
MGIALSAMNGLVEAGHDCLHLVEQNLERMQDAEIIKKADDEDRIILTHDLDFSRLLALSGRAKPSVITFRLSDMRPKSVTSKTTTIIEKFENDLTKGAAIVVTDKGIRHRKLPI